MNETIKKHVTKKRVISVCGLILVATSVYAYKDFTQPSTIVKYAVASGQRGMFIASLTGTGQVSGKNQIDVKPKASGDIVAVLVKQGQEVKKGEVLMELDRRDAVKTVRDAAQSVRDAEISLSSAKLSLAKLRQPASAASLLQATNTLNAAKRALTKLQDGPDAVELQQAEGSVQSAEQNAKISADGVTPQVVRNVYDSTVGVLIATSESVTDALSDADDVLGIDNTAANVSYVNLLSVMDQNRKSQATAEYSVAKTSVSNAKSLVAALAIQNESPAKIDAALLSLQDAIAKTIALLSSTGRCLDATVPSPAFSQSSIDSLKSTIQGDRTTLNTKQTGLVTQLQTIATAKTTYANSGLALQQAQLSLEKLKQGADPRDVDAAKEKVSEAEQSLADVKAGASSIDVQLSQNSLDQRVSALASTRNKLADVQETLNDYSVRAPFDGIIAKIPVQLGESAGASTAIATMVAKQKVADITLNEMDAAKVAVGQKVTLTFDAVDGLSISGEVVEVGTIGTVSQGVVSYAVKIGFDTQDDRVRSGMSVRTAIVTETKPDVLLVPNAAVKATGDQHYVEVMDATASSSAPDATGLVTGTPRRQMVEVGSSNDSVTEIVSGLTGTESVVVQTIQPTTAKATTSAASSVRIPGLTGGAGGGGGNFRGGAAIGR